MKMKAAVVVVVQAEIRMMAVTKRVVEAKALVAEASVEETVTLCKNRMKTRTANVIDHTLVQIPPRFRMVSC